MIVVLSLGGVISLAIEPTIKLAHTRTWFGIETKEHWELSNIFVGPDYFFLISELF